MGSAPFLPRGPDGAPRGPGQEVSKLRPLCACHLGDNDLFLSIVLSCCQHLVELYLRILNAVDRITCHWHKETIYSKKEFDLDGFDQSQ